MTAPLPEAVILPVKSCHWKSFLTKIFCEDLSILNLYSRCATCAHFVNSEVAHSMAKVYSRRPSVECHCKKRFTVKKPV